MTLNYTFIQRIVLTLNVVELQITFGQLFPAGICDFHLHSRVEEYPSQISLNKATHRY